MKKTVLLLTFLGFTFVNAQLIVTPNPFNINSGIITVTYGSNGDYSLYDPQFNPNLYLYTGFETDGVTTTWDYHDTWADVGTLIPLTWSSTANAYVATFDISSRTYTQESTNTVMTIPSGTTINNWYFIIRNADGSSQSGDQFGSNFGFSPSLSASNFDLTSINFYIHDNVISTNIQGKIEIEIYSLLGQKVSCYSVENYDSLLNLPLNLNQRGFYIATIKNNNKVKRLKFIY